MTKHGYILVELNRISFNHLALGRIEIFDAELIFRVTKTTDFGLCQTIRVICQTFLSDKTVDLSDNCRTFHGFCRTLLSDKMGVLSDKIPMRLEVKSAIFIYFELSLYTVSLRLNTIRWSEKKDKGRFSKPNLSDIVGHFNSHYLPILFSSSSSYYYYYYNCYYLYNLYYCYLNREVLRW